jgi:hypothetical protein
VPAKLSRQIERISIAALSDDPIDLCLLVLGRRLIAVGGGLVGVGSRLVCVRPRLIPVGKSLILLRAHVTSNTRLLLRRSPVARVRACDT